MENQNYVELVVKADDGEITTRETQILLVEMARKLEETERKSQKAIEKASSADKKATSTEEWRLRERPLMDTEATELDKAVKRKALKCVGGKDAPAYKNNRHSIFRKICMDIHLQIKRNYGLIDDRGRQLKYTGLKVKYLNGALEVVNEYELPVTLENEINAENEIGDDDE